MTDEARASAEKLYNKLNRDYWKAEQLPVTTVGVGKSTQGGEVLIVFRCWDDFNVPAMFDGYVVMPQSANTLRSIKVR